jgi:hypothetical protein
LCGGGESEEQIVGVKCGLGWIEQSSGRSRTLKVQDGLSGVGRRHRYRLQATGAGATGTGYRHYRGNRPQLNSKHGRGRVSSSKRVA